MSLLSWLFSKPVPPQSSGLPPDGLTAPMQPLSSGPSNTVAELKNQRHERREHLYSVVRSVMLRSEVLAATYKFKVLSLDARGRQFLIMVDLTGAHALHPDRWTPVEQLIAMTAAQRHDLIVKAVYWRLAEPVAEAAHTHAAPLVREVIAQTPVVAHTARPADKSRAGGFDPIGDDEVLAFKKAIAAQAPDASTAAIAGQVVRSGPRHSVRLTGYEDTQVIEPDDAASPLSGTQFGDLN